MEELHRKSEENQIILTKFLQTRASEDFEPLVRLNMGIVYGVIYRIALNTEDADDLVQETFIKAYEKIDTYRGKAKFSTWLCQIGINLAISHLRKRKRVIQVEHIDAINPDSSSHDQMGVGHEEVKRIHRAISKLSAKLRAVIILSAVEKMSLKEMAVTLNCPAATVYWRLHQARKKLRIILDAKECVHG